MCLRYAHLKERQTSCFYRTSERKYAVPFHRNPAWKSVVGEGDTEAMDWEKGRCSQNRFPHPGRPI